MSPGVRNKRAGKEYSTQYVHIRYRHCCIIPRHEYGWGAWSRQEIKSWQVNDKNHFVVKCFYWKIVWPCSSSSGNRYDPVGGAGLCLLWCLVIPCTLCSSSRRIFLKSLLSFINKNSIRFPARSGSFAFVFSLLFRMGDIISGILWHTGILCTVHRPGSRCDVASEKKRYKKIFYKCPLPAAGNTGDCDVGLGIYATGPDIIKSFLAVLFQELLFTWFRPTKKEWPFNDRWIFGRLMVTNGIAGFKIYSVLCVLCCQGLIVLLYGWLRIVEITDQGTEFEFTVVQKFNQGTIRKKWRILFRLFFDTFLRSKSIVKSRRASLSINGSCLKF